MNTIIRLGFLGGFIVLIGICYQGMRRITSYQPNQPIFSAPHVVSGYADTNQDGFVYPQGDPLYDEHYANNVNIPNSEALQGLNKIPVLAAEANLIQAEAERTEAETERIRQDAKMTLWGTRITLAIALAVVLLIIFMIAK